MEATLDGIATGSKAPSWCSCVRSGMTEALLQSEPPQTRKFEGGAAKVQPSYGIQYVDLNAFYPSKSEAAISTEIDADPCPGWRQPDPPAVNREVLADGSRGQRCGHLWDGTHDPTWTFRVPTMTRAAEW
jgi:hypothetical protein